MNVEIANAGKNDPETTEPDATRSVNLPAVAARPAGLAEFEMPTAAIVPAAMPNAMSLLVALRRRYKLALGVGPILAGLVAVAAWFLIPPAKYTARALLQVSSIQPKIIFKTEENRVDFGTYQRTQLTLLKSRNVLNKALNDAKVSKLAVVHAQVDPVLWLEKRVQADYVGEIFRIAMSGDKPDDLAILVNAVTEAYRKEVVEIESKERWSRYDELQKIYNDYQVKLEQKRTDLKKLTQKVGSKDKQTIRYTQELAIERLNTTRRELSEYQSELRKVRAELEVRAGQGRDAGKAALAAPSEMAIQREMDSDPQIKDLKGKIDKLKASYEQADRIARSPSDVALQDNRRRQDGLRKELEAKVTALRPWAIERLKEGGPGGDDDPLVTLRARIKYLEHVEKKTQEFYDFQLAENNSFKEDSNYIDAIQDEILLQDVAAKSVGAEIESLNVELKAPSRVRQFEAADTPRREEDKRAVMAGLAGFGTFGLFVLGIGLLELRSQRISSIDEVTRVVGLRIVGTLPTNRDQVRRGGRDAGEHGPYGGSLMAESIDSIRTMILHSTGDRPLRSIMVTSATSGEGKTSLACHLAMSLARSGMKTLLIDCDLRKPTIHRLFDVPEAPGFSEFLRDQAGPGEVIRATAVDGLDVITAGTCDARALRGLGRSGTGAIFDEFRGSHDIIVVDTSPILPVTDALLVGRHVDAAVYSILRDVSRLPWTLSAVGRLRSMNIRLLGVVVTGVRPPVYGSYYAGYGGEVHHG